TYDPDSLLLESITEPGGRELHVEHDAGGNLNLISDVDETERTLTYDQNGRLTQDEGGPLNAAVSGQVDEHFTHHPNSGALTEVNLGLGTVYQIDAAATLGLGASVAPDGDDEDGATVEDALDHTTTYLLDLQGRLLKQTNPEGD